MDTPKTPGTSLQLHLQKWEAKQNELVQRYGPRLGEDRDFLKAKQTVLQDIYDRHKGTRLNMEDKMEIAILKGQLKQMNRVIYPSRIVRGLVGLFKLLSRPLQHAAKLFVNLASTALMGKPLLETGGRPKARPTATMTMANRQQPDPPMQAVPPVQTAEERITQARRRSEERVLTEMPHKSLSVR